MNTPLIQEHPTVGQQQEPSLSSNEQSQPLGNLGGITVTETVPNPTLPRANHETVQNETPALLRPFTQVATFTHTL